MDENLYSLSVSGEGLQFEQDVDQQTAGAVVALVLRGEVPLPSLGSNQGALATSKEAESGSDANHEVSEDLSLGEFLEEVCAKRNPDKIVAMGVYLHDRGMSEFTPDDVKPLFQEAQEPTPANFSRDWRWAQSARWIAPARGGDGAFYVTKTGRDVVKDHFPADIRKRTAQSTGRRTRRKTAGTE